jgi:hypothetical protein
MNCHKFVTVSHEKGGGDDRKVKGWEGEKRRSEELQKLYGAVGFDPIKGEYGEEGEKRAMEWIRVHRLPDFVRFDHRRHVNAGVACQVCHGPVEGMERMVQWSSLTMGWCVNCHRDVNKGRVVSLQGKSASIDCSACHY